MVMMMTMRIMMRGNDSMRVMRRRMMKVMMMMMMRMMRMVMVMKMRMINLICLSRAARHFQEYASNPNTS